MDKFQDARITAGEDRTLEIDVSNPSGADLTGMSARYVVGPTPYGPLPPQIDKADGAGITILDTGLPVGVARRLRVTLTHQDTEDLVAGWHYHEASIELATGAVVVVMSGQLRVDPSLVNIL